MGKQSWKPGNMLNPVPAVMVSVARIGSAPSQHHHGSVGRYDLHQPADGVDLGPSDALFLRYDPREPASSSSISPPSRWRARATTAALSAAGTSTSSRRPVSRPSRSRACQRSRLSRKARSASPAASPRSRALGSHTMFIAEVVGVTADDRISRRDRPASTSTDAGPHYVLPRRVFRASAEVARQVRIQRAEKAETPKKIT